ncbi:MAG: hypothetical protein ACLP8A_03350 [Methylovirgula sp.]
MTTKFSPIIAMLLLAGAEVAAPNAAKSTEAHAATLDGMTPVRVRCFMAPMGNKWPMADDRTDMRHGWLCMPEKVTSYTH